MELKEMVKIFKKNIRLFLAIIILSVLAGAMWKTLSPARNEAVFAVHVTRTGTQETDDYKYDDFYRLQADEKFSDTVARWMQSPQIVSEILKKTGTDLESHSIRSLESFFEAKKMSPQMIEVSYDAEDFSRAKEISESVVETLNRQTSSLNKEQKSANWFLILGSDPLVEKKVVSWPSVLAVSFLVGFLISFWTVLIWHYWKNEDRQISAS